MLFILKTLFCLTALFLNIQLQATLAISEKEAETVGRLIWQNECSSKKDYLTWWNAGESFASLGIGHFIWHPDKDDTSIFEQQFPDFVKFAIKEGVSVPEWLRATKTCPWHSREEFFQDFNSAKMVELRQFLFTSFITQARFIAKKLESVLPKILMHLCKEEKDHVSEMFNRVISDKKGVYILADYLNFKGDGCNLKERYADMGWGLLQVLQNMANPSSTTPAEEFARSAKAILLRRVENAPLERNEMRWLPGWYKRIDTYITRE